MLENANIHISLRITTKSMFINNSTIILDTDLYCNPSHLNSIRFRKQAEYCSFKRNLPEKVMIFNEFTMAQLFYHVLRYFIQSDTIYEKLMVIDAQNVK